MSAVVVARETSAKYLSTLQPPLVQHFELMATAPGGVARLRELILTLAVQGKLVSQDPRDEPASELLKKIKVVRDLPVAKGKLSRDKALAPVGNEEAPFQVPSGWEWVRFSAIAVFENGDRGPNYPSRSSFVDQGVAFINAGHLVSERIDYSDMNYITQQNFSLLRSGKVQRSDILYCLRGSLGKFALVTGDAPGAIASSLVIIRLLDLAVTAYALSYLKSPLAEALIRRFDNGTAQPNLGAGDLARFVVPLPPLAEQTRIVTRVEELMRLCDALEAKGQLEAAQHAQLVQTLLGALTASTSPEELADNWQRVATHFDLLLDRPEAIDALEQTILQLAVRGLLIPQDPKDEPAGELLKKIRSEKDHLIAEGRIKRDKPMEPVAIEDVPFVLPKGWSWVRFDELINPLKPIAYGVLVPGPDVETGVPFVRIADLSIDNPAPMPEKSIGRDIDSQFQRTRLEGGEILMGVVGSIGKLGVAPPTWAGANIARAICRIVPADSGLREFVLFLLQTEFMQQSFVGDTRTLAQPTLNVGLIRQALTPVPPPAEQARIVARVGLLRRHCAELRQRLAARQTIQAHLAEALIAEVA